MNKRINLGLGLNVMYQAFITLILLVLTLVTPMLNSLLESCLKQFEPLTKNHFEHVEPLETFNLIRTLFMESCPSLIPPTAENKDTEFSSSQALIDKRKDKYICKGLDLCWHAHSIGQFRRPLFKSDGELTYLPIPCGRNNTIPASGIKNCHHGNTCTLAHSQNEINFHPLTYRTVPCQKSKSKCTTKYCPFYHKKSEKRSLKPFFKPTSQKTSSSTSQKTPDNSLGVSSSDISVLMMK